MSTEKESYYYLMDKDHSIKITVTPSGDEIAFNPDGTINVEAQAIIKASRIKAESRPISALYRHPKFKKILGEPPARRLLVTPDSQKINSA